MRKSKPMWIVIREEDFATADARYDVIACFPSIHDANACAETLNKQVRKKEKETRCMDTTVYEVQPVDVYDCWTHVKDS